MARAPQVVSTVPLEIPRQSLQGAAAPYEALSQVGGAVAAWGARELELQRHREAMQKSLDASLAADAAYREESARPDHTDLDLRMKGRLEEIHKEYTGSIKSALVKREFERSFDSLTLDKMINARSEKARREIEAYQGTYQGRMDYLAERASNATGTELDVMRAEAQAQTDAAVVNQAITPEQAVVQMHNWIDGVRNLQTRREVEAASLDPSLEGDKELLRINEALKSGEGYEGLDPSHRQALAEMVDDVIARRQRNDTWQNDPFTASSVSNEIHRTDGPPRITHADIMALYAIEHKLTWDTAHMLANELDAMLDATKGGTENDPDKPATLAQRQEQAEQEWKTIFGEDGPFAILGQLDQSTKQIAGDAFHEIGRRSTYFRGYPNELPGDHLEDPYWEAWPDIKRQYLPLMTEAGQGYINTRRKHLKAGPSTKEDPMGFINLKQRMGDRQKAIADGNEDAWVEAMREMKQLEEMQAGVNQVRQFDIVPKPAKGTK